MRSAIVIGGDGLIGKALTTKLTKSIQSVHSTSRRKPSDLSQIYYDLSDSVSVLSQKIHWIPDVVFVCAAVTGFAACSQDPVGSRKINVSKTLEISTHFMRQGVRVVYLSSNAVFDGSRLFIDESADLCPESIYGSQKAECESMLLAASASLLGSCAVVRLTKVVDPAMNLFGHWLNCLKNKVSLKAAIDLVISPITIPYVVEGLQIIGAGDIDGVFHLSGERNVTYFQLAKAMAKKLGLEAVVEMDYVQQRLGTASSPKNGKFNNDFYYC